MKYQMVVVEPPEGLKAALQVRPHLKKGMDADLV